METECQKRRDEVTTLQTRLDHLQKDSQGWRADLEEREDQIHNLEARLKDREAALKEAGESRERLNVLVNGVTEARKDADASSIMSSVSSVQKQDNPIETQLVELQRTHAAILKDYEQVSYDYKAALREIAELKLELEEAKVNASIPPSRLSESPERPAEVGSHRRRMTRGMSKDGLDVQSNGTGRRLFYRQAVSTESLHARYVFDTRIYGFMYSFEVSGRCRNLYRSRRSCPRPGRAKPLSQVTALVVPSLCLLIRAPRCR